MKLMSTMYEPEAQTHTEKRKTREEHINKTGGKKKGTEMTCLVNPYLFEVQPQIVKKDGISGVEEGLAKVGE